MVENDSSSDEELLLASHRNVVPHVVGATSVVDATQLDVESGQLPRTRSQRVHLLPQNQIQC